jgi:CDP-paratose 2-epimerase
MNALITGAYGLVGSACVDYFHQRGFEVYGIDNNMRADFFGESASNHNNKFDFCHYYYCDVSDFDELYFTMSFMPKFDLIIHAAAQPSHDFSARNPRLDFAVNGCGTLNVLEIVREHSPDAVFIYVSTNKVYGDHPNRLPLIEYEKRYDCKSYINESMPVDDCMHSPFGVSKLAGDIYTQEYGRYYGMKVGVFRCGCITGMRHAGVELHGFLSYLCKCARNNKVYKIYGYKGKQVRDNIHASDLVSAFYEFYQNPRPGEVYNMGGGIRNNVSILEAVGYIEAQMGRNIQTEYIDQPRKGDHIWYVSDTSKFRKHYPNWLQQYDITDMIKEML